MKKLIISKLIQYSLQVTREGHRAFLNAWP